MVLRTLHVVLRTLHIDKNTILLWKWSSPFLKVMFLSQHYHCLQLYIAPNHKLSVVNNSYVLRTLHHFNQGYIWLGYCGIYWSLWNADLIIIKGFTFFSLDTKKKKHSLKRKQIGQFIHDSIWVMNSWRYPCKPWIWRSQSSTCWCKMLSQTDSEVFLALG